MKLTLITMGRTDVAWVREGMEIYVSRLKHYVKFSVVEIPQLKNTSALSFEEIKVREGELILKQLRPSDYFVLLDEKGKEYSSAEWAKYLENRMNSCTSDMIFAIGGAYGFSDKVYERADSKISLSRMTFSHQMVRAIFVEQLYRAFTILKGEPYHHE